MISPCPLSPQTASSCYPHPSCRCPIFIALFALIIALIISSYRSSWRKNVSLYRLNLCFIYGIWNKVCGQMRRNKKTTDISHWRITGDTNSIDVVLSYNDAICSVYLRIDNISIEYYHTIHQMISMQHFLLLNKVVSTES